VSLRDGQIRRRAGESLLGVSAIVAATEVRGLTREQAVIRFRPGKRSLQPSSFMSGPYSPVFASRDERSGPKPNAAARDMEWCVHKARASCCREA